MEHVFPHDSCRLAFILLLKLGLAFASSHKLGISGHTGQKLPSRQKADLGSGWFLQTHTFWFGTRIWMPYADTCCRHSAYRFTWCFKVSFSPVSPVEAVSLCIDFEEGRGCRWIWFDVGAHIWCAGVRTKSLPHISNVEVWSRFPSFVQSDPATKILTAMRGEGESQVSFYGKGLTGLEHLPSGGHSRLSSERDFCCFWLWFCAVLLWFLQASVNSFMLSVLVSRNTILRHLILLGNCILTV